jgi:hypothetical protein
MMRQPKQLLHGNDMDMKVKDHLASGFAVILYNSDAFRVYRRLYGIGHFLNSLGQVPPLHLLESHKYSHNVAWAPQVCDRHLWAECSKTLLLSSPHKHGLPALLGALFCKMCKPQSL